MIYDLELDVFDFLNSMPKAAIITDIKGKIRYCNNQAQKKLKCTRTFVLGKNIADFFSSKDSAFLRKAIKNTKNIPSILQSSENMFCTFMQ